MCRKKIIVIISASTLIFFAVTGCASNNTHTIASSTESTLTSASSVPSISPTSYPQTSASISPTTNSGDGNSTIKDLVATIQSVSSVSLDFTAVTIQGKHVSGSIAYEKGKMVKAVINSNDSSVVVITDIINKTETSYQPSTKQGIKRSYQTTAKQESKISEAEELLISDQISYLANIVPGCIVDLGSDTINNIPCKLIQYSSPYARPFDSWITIEMWIDDSINYPVRIINTAPDGKSNQINYSNIKIGALPNDTFDIPSDITIKDLTKNG